MGGERGLGAGARRHRQLLLLLALVAVVAAAETLGQGLHLELLRELQQPVRSQRPADRR
jgi:hypothetical protein